MCVCMYVGIYQKGAVVGAPYPIKICYRQLCVYSSTVKIVTYWVAIYSLYLACKVRHGVKVADHSAVITRAGQEELFLQEIHHTCPGYTTPCKASLLHFGSTGNGTALSPVPREERLVSFTLREQCGA